jgi:hypothetical protein
MTGGVSAGKDARTGLFDAARDAEFVGLGEFHLGGECGEGGEADAEADLRVGFEGLGGAGEPARIDLDAVGGEVLVGEVDDKVVEPDDEVIGRALGCGGRRGWLFGLLGAEEALQAVGLLLGRAVLGTGRDDDLREREGPEAGAPREEREPARRRGDLADADPVCGGGEGGVGEADIGDDDVAPGSDGDVAEPERDAALAGLGGHEAADGRSGDDGGDEGEEEEEGNKSEQDEGGAAPAGAEAGGGLAFGDGLGGHAADLGSGCGERITARMIAWQREGPYHRGEVGQESPAGSRRDGQHSNANQGASGKGGEGARAGRGGSPRPVSAA